MRRVSRNPLFFPEDTDTETPTMTKGNVDTVQSSLHILLCDWKIVLLSLVIRNHKHLFWSVDLVDLVFFTLLKFLFEFLKLWLPLNKSCVNREVDFLSCLD